jgi:predicted AAA+ superfamily ATPase
MVERKVLARTVKAALKRSRVVALIGPRQCGKTTAARGFLDAGSPNYFDLEDPVSCARLNEPMMALQDLKGLVVIDEIQRNPDLFPVLRVLADRERPPCRFLILGSASPDLVKHSSESLAGRVETIEMAGFCLGELGFDAARRHWLRGGFPLSYLARSEPDSFTWRRNFVRTFIERDLPLSGVTLPSAAMLRFWTMLAHYHGQVWNAAEPARSLGISESSVRRYLDLLTDMYLIRQLQPWHANLKKRQIKAPKIYFRDSGLAHLLLGVHTHLDLSGNPKYGASWEGYVIEEIIRAVGPEEVFYWATHAGAELDLLMVKNGSFFGVECKRSDAPVMTPSMHIALKDCNLEQIAVIYPGTKRYSLSKNVHAVPFTAVMGGLHDLFPS